MNFKYDTNFYYYKHYIFVCTRVLVDVHVLDIVKLISACIWDQKNLLKYNLPPVKNWNYFPIEKTAPWVKMSSYQLGHHSSESSFNYLLKECTSLVGSIRSLYLVVLFSYSNMNKVIRKWIFLTRHHVLLQYALFICVLLLYALFISTQVWIDDICSFLSIGNASLVMQSIFRTVDISLFWNNSDANSDIRLMYFLLPWTTR